MKKTHPNYGKNTKNGVGEWTIEADIELNLMVFVLLNSLDLRESNKTKTIKFNSVLASIFRSPIFPGINKQTYSTVNNSYLYFWAVSEESQTLKNKAYYLCTTVKPWDKPISDLVYIMAYHFFWSSNWVTIGKFKNSILNFPAVKRLSNSLRYAFSCSIKESPLAF